MVLEMIHIIEKKQELVWGRLVFLTPQTDRNSRDESGVGRGNYALQNSQYMRVVL